MTHNTTDLRNPVIFIHKWFLTLQGGDATMRKTFLTKEEWLCLSSLSRKGARCSGCLRVVEFHVEYDADAWTAHRDLCSAIEKRMMTAVARALEFPAGDMDEYGLDEAYYGHEDQWSPVNNCTPDDRWSVLMEILTLSEKPSEEAEENVGQYLKTTSVTQSEAKGGASANSAREGDVGGIDDSSIPGKNDCYYGEENTGSGCDISTKGLSVQLCYEERYNPVSDKILKQA
ncbi:uncharacterized protein EV420DRAFT_1531972 [Desarmillaria tabescens]|uniref:Uncharacterized protein n=1 Tax=Armillaria tabescens TaxID=1929756 RepID=A0AA39N7D9_ARMTA|nr:uncharacterized protein EV420DRAFT_1531972 [Desarmillaria tabescens]KAK0460384.1 hypothetical protein EV420DRAFT_1531972 [Desarmillaria tabescens]